MRPRRGGRALRRLLRAMASILLVVLSGGTAGILCDTVEVHTSWLRGLAGIVPVSYDMLMLLTAMVLAVPGAMLAGIIARPYWWAPAIAPFLFWFMVSGAGGPDADDIVVLLVRHLGGTAVVAVSGLLGALCASRPALRSAVIVFALVEMGAAGGASLGMYDDGVLWDPVLFLWVLLCGMQAGLAVALLSACWTPDRTWRWLLRIGGTVWLIGLLTIAGLGFWLTCAQELEWYLSWLVGALGLAGLGLLAFAAAVGRRVRMVGRLALWHVLIAAAAIGALVLAWALIAMQAEAPGVEGLVGEGPGYLRLEVPGGSVVYVKLDEHELRVGTSPKEVETAEPTFPHRGERGLSEFREIPLPVSAEDLPAGCEGLEASFSAIEIPGYGWGRRRQEPEMMFRVSVRFLYQDEAGAQWTYWTEGDYPSVGPAPESPGVFEIPAIGDLSLTIEARPGREGGDTVGLAVLALAGESPLGDIQRNGESVRVRLAVTDSFARQVTLTAGTLEDLGFT